MKLKKMLLIFYICLPISVLFFCIKSNSSNELGHINLKRQHISIMNHKTTTDQQYKIIQSTVHKKSIGITSYSYGLHTRNKKKHALLKIQHNTTLLASNEGNHSQKFSTIKNESRASNTQKNAFTEPYERAFTEFTESTQNNNSNIQFAPPTGNEFHNIPNPDLPMPLNHSLMYLSFFLILYSIKSYNKHN